MRVVGTEEAAGVEGVPWPVRQKEGKGIRHTHLHRSLWIAKEAPFLPVLEGHLVVRDLGARSTSCQCVKTPTNEMVPWIWRWWYPYGEEKALRFCLLLKY